MAHTATFADAPTLACRIHSRLALNSELQYDGELEIFSDWLARTGASRSSLAAPDNCQTGAQPTDSVWYLRASHSQFGSNVRTPDQAG